MESVTVIICTWNRSAQLRQTLHSLAQQQGIAPDQVEVIVVDNNSNDDTRAVVEEIAQGWRLGILRYAFEPRQGKQFALNRGVAAATNPVLAFTDDDILFTTGWLANAAAAFSDPGVQLVGGITDLVWPSNGPPRWFADDMMAVVGGVNLGQSKLDPAPTDYAPAGANLIARRTLFEQVGGFSELHYRHMDHEFGMRCHRERVRVVYDPALRVFAPVDAMTLDQRYFRRWAFKAGIASDTPDNGVAPQSPARLPMWLYRQVLQDGVLLLLLLFERPSKHFSRELRVWRHMGTIAGHWHARLRPRTHQAWVAVYSQKKNNRRY